MDVVTQEAKCDKSSVPMRAMKQVLRWKQSGPYIVTDKCLRHVECMEKISKHSHGSLYLISHAIILQYEPTIVGCFDSRRQFWGPTWWQLWKECWGGNRTIHCDCQLLDACRGGGERGMENIQLRSHGTLYPETRTVMLWYIMSQQLMDVSTTQVANVFEAPLLASYETSVELAAGPSIVTGSCWRHEEDAKTI